MAWGRTYNVIQRKEVLLSRKKLYFLQFLACYMHGHKKIVLSHIEDDDAVEIVSIFNCQTADEERC